MKKTHLPCSRFDLIERLATSRELSESERSEFREFATILTALVHFQAHAEYERMKTALSHVDGHEVSELPEAGLTRDGQASQLIEDLVKVLERANYRRLESNRIYDALNKASIIPVRTEVEFRDYQEFLFYYRYRTPQKILIKKFLRQREITIRNHDRMVVILRTAVTLKNRKSSSTLAQVEGLVPNRVYLNLYKDIPEQDLELLFPNIKISMTWRDRLLLMVPALGAAVPLTLKILPSLGLLVGIIALTIFGFELGGTFRVEPGSQKAGYALLTALLSITLALGGFAAQQFLKYKSKRLTFLKKVTDTLFFKTLDVGKGVISTLVDAAEEEQCKEMLLTYFLLFSARNGLTRQQLDEAAEQWLQREFNDIVDFKVDKALQELRSLTANSTQNGLITKGSNGGLRVCDLSAAKQRLDSVWDDAFRYGSASSTNADDDNKTPRTN